MGSTRALAFEQARAKWPEVILGYDVWCAHLETLGWLDDLPATAGSLFLCCACARRDPAACRWLDEECLTALRGVVVKEDASEDFVDWVLECARTQLLGGEIPKISTYDGRRPLAVWLRLIVRRLAFEQKRADRGALPAPPPPESPFSGLRRARSNVSSG
jgi:hypothetical protein